MDAWEASPSKHVIDQGKYPLGFSDEYDKESIHLIATAIGSNVIMSACRVTLFKTCENYPYVYLDDMGNFPKKNLSLIGRGVKDINFKHKRLQYDFVTRGPEISKQNGMEYATGHAYNENI